MPTSRRTGSGGGAIGASEVGCMIHWQTSASCRCLSNKHQTSSQTPTLDEGAELSSFTRLTGRSFFDILWIVPKELCAVKETALLLAVVHTDWAQTGHIDPQALEAS
ncbi:unnamed protein product [Durusdinium trenchii]|uniref:Uncharacterized protein n=1 Tax=Durusdinium trenchii TaxID=1381693 RepID=A0ABP0SYZ8_9DINO